MIGKKYKHFKGNIYRVIALCKDSETLNDMVVYEDINDHNKVWVRSLEMFNEKLDKDKYPDIDQEYRFTLID